MKKIVLIAFLVSSFLMKTKYTAAAPDDPCLKMLELTHGASLHTLDGIEVAFYVPAGYTKNKKTKVMIGVSPGMSPGYSGVELRNLLSGLAENQNIVIACPVKTEAGIAALVKKSLTTHILIHADSMYAAGYSKGGASALLALYADPTSFKGFLGIAPAIQPDKVASFDLENGKTIPTAIVAGDSDYFIQGITSFINTLTNKKGKCILKVLNRGSHESVFIPSEQNTKAFLEAFAFIK